MKNLNRLTKILYFFAFLGIALGSFLLGIKYSDDVKKAAMVFKESIGATESEDSRDELYALYDIPLDKSDAEKQDDINAILSDRAQYIKVDTQVFMTSGDYFCKLNIGNDPENDIDYVVSIVIDDGNQEVYRSGLISPGFYIGRTKLNTTLESGSYPCTVFFIAYEPETQIEIGQVIRKLDIIVNED